MTYSLIPPILVVLSIIGIILFLMKKVPKIALLEEKRMDAERPSTVFSSQLSSGSGKRAALGGYWLLVLEKVTRRLKITILKLENIFSSWNESIKKKRNGREDRKNIIQPDNEAPAANIEQKIMDYMPKREDIERKDVRINHNVVPSQKKRRVVLDEVREKKVKPMLSERVVAPRGGVQLKGRLEKLLIERIAANPKDIEAYERLGEYYFEIGNLTHSKECFKQIVKLDRNNANARAKLRKLETMYGGN